MTGIEVETQAIQAAVAAEEWATARRLAAAVAEKYPDHAHAWLWMAWVSEEPAQSLRYAQRAATLSPELGKAAVTWAQSRMGDVQPPATPRPALYTKKAKGEGIRAWQIVTLAIIMASAAMLTMWGGGMFNPTPVQRPVGQYANLPVNIDRANDRVQHQPPTPESANRALEVVALEGAVIPSATPFAFLTPTPSASPLPSATPTLVAAAEMMVDAREESPPPVVPTATVLPIDARDLLFPVWPYRFEPILYRVQAGDNLTTLATRCGLTPWTLIWANDEGDNNPQLLTIGQELWIPPLDGVLHVVRPGDTIEGLAAQYKVDVNIIRWFEGNDLEGDGNQLVAGQRVMVPGGVKPIESLPPAPAAPTTRGGASYFGWPTTGVMTQNYGSYHNGIDIANSSKTPIFAAQSGEVVFAGWDNSGYGYAIVLDHNNGWRTRYAHLSGMYPAVGDWVNRGDLIALMGSTGNSTGPHLHFEIITRGYRFNPMNYLPK